MCERSRWRTLLPPTDPRVTRWEWLMRAVVLVVVALIWVATSGCVTLPEGGRESFVTRHPVVTAVAVGLAVGAIAASQGGQGAGRDVEARHGAGLCHARPGC